MKRKKRGSYLLCLYFILIHFPGIDSWIQPRLNLRFSWVLNPGNLGEPSEQVTQVSWVLEPTLPSLAGFIKTNKKPGFSWVCWVCCRSNKTLRAGFTGFQNPANPGYLGSGTQLTQVTWHSCYGWKQHFLAKKHYAIQKNIYNSAKTYGVLLK